VRSKNSGRRRDEERRQQIAQLRAEGLTFAQIGQQLGVTRQCAQFLLKKSGRAVRVPGIACCACGREIGPWRGTSRNLSPVLCLACLAKNPAATPGQRLRAYRVAAGLTQEELAHKSGLSRMKVRSFEQDRHQPWPEHARRLAEALGVPVDAFSGNVAPKEKRRGRSA
jgi:DNA-binding XRE family transcriptional regulator